MWSNARVSTARKTNVDTITNVPSAIRIHRGLAKIFQEPEGFIQLGFDPDMDAMVLEQKNDWIQAYRQAATPAVFQPHPFPRRSRKPSRIRLDSILCEGANPSKGRQPTMSRGHPVISCAVQTLANADRLDKQSLARMR